MKVLLHHHTPFALERGDLFKRRLDYYRQRDNLHGLPIAVVDVVIDLRALVEHSLEALRLAPADRREDTDPIRSPLAAVRQRLPGRDRDGRLEQLRILAELAV